MLFGSILMLSGWGVVMTIVGIPFGLPMFAAGLGLILTPRKRAR